MEKRSFQEKRSPSKNSGTPKQRFKPPLFGNDEKHPGPQGPTQSIQLEPPIAGKIRAPRSTERTQSRKSESSISGENVFQDETSLFPNSKLLAKSLPDTSQVPSAGPLASRGRPTRLSETGDFTGTGNGKGGENSPDSGSMISDDGPSGYNSGEQYDTLSAGYMSDMAGRITDTDTRMDWRETNLDVIEESRDNVGAGMAGNIGGISKKSSDEEDEEDELFLVPPPPPVTANPAITGMLGAGFIGHATANGNMHDRMIDYDRASTTSSSDANEMLDTTIDMGENPTGIRQGGTTAAGGPLGGAHHTSPINFPGSKSKIKKKVTTFAVPIEASPLSSGSGFPRNDSFGNNAYMDESSDANIGMGSGGMHLKVGGYRTVPSDTDTTDAIESDGCAIATETGTDSGTDNPNSGAHRPLVKTSRQDRKAMRRFKKKMENHDDEWFAAHDNRYWKMTRFICFWGSVLSMILATVAAGIFIAFMPRNCNPEIDWYHGTVSLDVAPSLNGKGVPKLDLGQLLSRIPYYHSVGIQTIHLRDISKKSFQDSSSGKKTNNKNDLIKIYHPTSRIIDLAKGLMNTEVDSNLNSSLKNLASSLHQLNMTLMIHLPIVSGHNNSQGGEMSLELQQEVSQTIRYFMQEGADGIFLDGLEHFATDKWVAEKVKIWHDMLDQYGITNRSRILMTSYLFAHNLAKADNEKADDAMKNINLLDATLNLQSDSSERDADEIAIFNSTSDSVNKIVMWDTVKGRPWINWNLDTENLPLSNAALALQMLLPGTINIGNTEGNIAIQDLDIFEHVDINNQTLAGDRFQNMTLLRAIAVPIYMNGNYKRCDCPDSENGHMKETNFLMHQPMQDVIQLERFYSRRNRFVLVANFGSIEIDLTPIGRIYSGGELVLDTSNTLPHLLNTDVQFKSITLSPQEAIVMKLPK